MIDALMADAETPPKEVKGVSQAYLDGKPHLLILSAKDFWIRSGRGLYLTFADGLPYRYPTELERVPRKLLQKTMDCPICSNPFLDDPYPLVVRLPCSPKHMFDLECIAPWLKLQATCPLDRKDVSGRKKKEVEEPKAEEADEEEGEWDDMYA